MIADDVLADSVQVDKEKSATEKLPIAQGVSMNERHFVHTQSLIAVTPNSQASSSRNQLCIHPSSLSNSSAASLDHNQSRVNFEFNQSLAVRHDSKLFISSDAEKSEVASCLSDSNTSNNSHDYALHHMVCLYPLSFFCMKMPI